MNSLKSILVVLVLVVCGHAFAQPTSDQSTQANRILKKIRQVEIANQILPLLLKKEQMSKILTAVEKARNEVKKTERDELDMLKRLESKLDDALKDTEKGIVPKQELFKEVAASFATMNLKRKAVGDENIENVFKVVDATLTDGQKNAAANAINWKVFDPTIDPEKMSRETKVRYYVRIVLLDPTAYDVMVKLPLKD